MQEIPGGERKSDPDGKDRDGEDLSHELHHKGDPGFSVIYLSSTDLFESLSYRRKEENEEEQGQGEAALEADLLLIDDLGTELSNSFTASKLFYVINQRMVMKRSTILSTNLNFGAIRDTYSDRVVSRLMSEDYDIIPLYGRDQRIPS